MLLRHHDPRSDGWRGGRLGEGHVGLNAEELAVLDRLIEAAVLEQKVRQLAPLERKVQAALAAFWRKQGRRFLLGLEQIRGTLGVSEGRRLREAVAKDWEDLWAQVSADMADELQGAMEDGVETALLTGGVSVIADLGDLVPAGTTWNLENPRAVKALEDHWPGLISGLDDTTRDRLRTVIADGLEQGEGYARIAGSIGQLFEGFSDYRAETVAITETAWAYEQGTRGVIDDLTDAGLEFEKSWLAEEDACDICDGNVDDGWIPADDDFSSGDQQPPGHARCRCTALWRRVGSDYADTGGEEETPAES